MPTYLKLSFNYKGLHKEGYASDDFWLIELSVTYLCKSFCFLKTLLKLYLFATYNSDWIVKGFKIWKLSLLSSVDSNDIFIYVHSFHIHLATFSR